MDLAQGHKYYELNKPYPHHHAHLICLRCHRVIEFKINSTFLNGGIEAVDQAKYHLLNCQLIVHVVCHACQGNK